MRKILLFLVIPFFLFSCGGEKEVSKTEKEVLNNIESDIHHINSQLEELRNLVSNANRGNFETMMKRDVPGGDMPLVIDQVIRGGEFSYMITSQVLEANANIMSMLAAGESPGEIHGAWETRRDHILNELQNTKAQFQSQQKDIEKMREQEGGAQKMPGMPSEPPHNPKKPQ